MNKAKHRLLTPNELAEQRKELAQKAYAKMVAAQKARSDAAPEVAKMEAVTPSPNPLPQGGEG